MREPCAATLFCDVLWRVACARAPKPFITQPELSRLMTWKLAHGKFRPNLQKFVDAASDDAVRAASEAAFRLSASGHVDRALSSLMELKGVRAHASLASCVCVVASTSLAA